MSTTIDDIARACNLSRSTVSRVLQNSPNVSEKSRQIVEKTIKELSYQPNQMAQSLAQGYSNTVALIVGNISSHAQIEIAKVIQKGLYDQKFMVWLCNSDYDRALCDSYLDIAIASKVAGAFIITSDVSSGKLAEADRSGMPVVLINRQNLSASCDCIFGNDEKGAYQAVSYLASCGHKNIILLSVPQSLITGRNAYWGYRAAICDCGLHFSDENVYEIDIATYSDAFKERHPFDASRIFREHPEATAIVCLSNEVAVDFFLQCKSLKKSIPDDISLLSLDPVQTSKIPGITFTTSGTDQQLFGETAVKQMLERIRMRKENLQAEKKYSSTNIVLEPVFKPGNTVKVIC